MISSCRVSRNLFHSLREQIQGAFRRFARPVRVSSRGKGLMSPLCRGVVCSWLPSREGGTGRAAWPLAPILCALSHHLLQPRLSAPQRNHTESVGDFLLHRLRSPTSENRGFKTRSLLTGFTLLVQQPPALVTMSHSL